MSTLKYSADLDLYTTTHCTAHVAVVHCAYATQNKKFLHQKHVGEASYISTVSSIATQTSQLSDMLAAHQMKDLHKLQALTAQTTAAIATESLAVGTYTPGTAAYGEYQHYALCTMHSYCCILRLVLCYAWYTSVIPVQVVYDCLPLLIVYMGTPSRDIRHSHISTCLVMM
jgi:hypothetical protein